MSNTADKFSRFVEVVKKLRDPNGGCPWDLEQNHETLRPYIVEETYEVLDAIEMADDNELKKELGDLLLQVVLHAQVARDRGAFTIDDVVEEITKKMIRRHPHVFGETKVSGSDEVLRNWEAIKHGERVKDAGAESEPSSMLAGVPQSMPALLRAQRLGEKAAKVSFDWDTLNGVWEKVLEETEELRVEISALNPSSVSRGTKISDAQRPALEHELGDALFSLCQLARWVGLSAEDSLRACCKRFTERFHLMETILNRPLAELSEEQLEAAWQEAKRRLP